MPEYIFRRMSEKSTCVFLRRQLPSPARWFGASWEKASPGRVAASHHTMAIQARWAILKVGHVKYVLDMCSRNFWGKFCDLHFYRPALQVLKYAATVEAPRWDIYGDWATGAAQIETAQQPRRSRKSILSSLLGCYTIFDTPLIHNICQV